MREIWAECRAILPIPGIYDIEIWGSWTFDRAMAAAGFESGDGDRIIYLENGRDQIAYRELRRAA